MTVSIYLLAVIGIFCTDGKHDQMDFDNCLTAPEKVYAATTLGCDVRVEAVDVIPSESQIKAMEASGKFKFIDCRKEKK